MTEPLVDQYPSCAMLKTVLQNLIEEDQMSKSSIALEDQIRGVETPVSHRSSRLAYAKVFSQMDSKKF